ncbi:MAG: peptidase U32 family protein, partial [Alkalispirochaeta sp.]
MELLSPAGSVEKLRIAYRYGADAAYIGIGGFSLRSTADSVFVRDAPDDGGGTPVDHAARIAELEQLKRLDGRPRKLYGALNLFAHEHDLRELPRILETLRAYPLDALILADIGLIEPIRRVMPDIDLHLSTQANCTNSAAARLYHRLGFSRIVAARELSLDDIRSIRDAVPDLEVEVFVHGAMCMSYSGRCFLSTMMTGRSANRGDCAHSCRWNYAITEEKRPGEYYPIEEDRRFSTILSSRDLMLYDYLDELYDAGVTAVKIEGRMKSALYAAVTTGAYRFRIDAVDPARDHQWRRLLHALSHREYTAGFLFNDETVHRPADGASPAGYRLMGILRDRRGERRIVEAKNAIHRTASVQVLTVAGELHRIE